MRKLFLIVLCFILLSSCDDDTNNTQNSTQQNIATIAKNKNSIGGISYNLDSVNNYVILKCNENIIGNICSSIIEKLVFKNKDSIGENLVGTAMYGFHFTKETIDSLKYYNYDYNKFDTIEEVNNSEEERSIGKGPQHAFNPEILITGDCEDIKNGVWNKIEIYTGIDYLKKGHPTLYNKGVKYFLNEVNPQMYRVAITKRGDDFIEYNAKINNTNCGLCKDEIYYGIYIIGNKLVIKVGNSYSL